MRKKVILLLGISVTLIISIVIVTMFAYKSNPNKLLGKGTVEGYEVSSFVTDEIKDESESALMSALLSDELTPDNLKEEAENIAIVRVISLDYSSTEFDTIVGNTFGSMLINTVLKGNLQEGNVVSYASKGGYLTISEWEKNQPAAANEKRDYLRAQNNKAIDKDSTYIHLQFNKCVDAEAGQTYLAYFNYNEEMGKYEIIGFQNGFMKLDIPQENSRISTLNIKNDEIRVLNNNTNEYENFKNYIIEHIEE